MIYSVICHNNIVAPQLGVEYNLPLCRWLSFATMGKGAWGVNYLTTDVNMAGSNLGVAFDTMRHATVFAQVYNIGAFADINILERLRLRLGYTATWLTGVATANDQVDFNLHGSGSGQLSSLLSLLSALAGANGSAINNVSNSIPHGRVNNNGSILYFGPQIELQFFF
jgi:hypothetical protein